MQTNPADRAAAQQKSRSADSHSWGSSALENLKSLTWAVAIALFIRVVLFEAFEIEGPSMEPGLLYGDRVIVAKYLYGLFPPFRQEALLNWGSPKPGDVIILASPAEDVDIIKRVLAVPGDTVEIRDEVLYRNGTALPLRQVGPCRTGYGNSDPMCRVFESEIDGHAFQLSMAGPMGDLPVVHVPDDHVFVMGDHRDMSNDSRNPDLGPISVTRIKGRGLAIYWSRGREGIRWSRLFSKLP
jgi:signal peptidase I